MSPEHMTVLRAQEIARRSHEGQVDKSGQDYYQAHVADVARRVGSDLKLRAVAYLHDVVEDTAWTLEGLAHVGFPGDVVLAVDAITHRPNEPRSDYYARVRANPLALAVKFADIASNTDPDRIALLDEPTRDRLTRKYRDAVAALGEQP